MVILVPVHVWHAYVDPPLIVVRPDQLIGTGVDQYPLHVLNLEC